MVKAKKQGEYHWDKGDVSWMPAQKQKKKPNLMQKLNQKKKYTDYRTSGGEGSFEEWLKKQ